MLSSVDARLYAGKVHVCVSYILFGPELDHAHCQAMNVYFPKAMQEVTEPIGAQPVSEAH